MSRQSPLFTDEQLVAARRLASIIDLLQSNKGRQAGTKPEDIVDLHRLATDLHVEVSQIVEVWQEILMRCNAVKKEAATHAGVHELYRLGLNTILPDELRKAA